MFGCGHVCRCVDPWLGVWTHGCADPCVDTCVSVCGRGRGGAVRDPGGARLPCVALRRTPQVELVRGIV